MCESITMPELSHGKFKLGNCVPGINGSTQTLINLCFLLSLDTEQRGTHDNIRRILMLPEKHYIIHNCMLFWMITLFSKKNAVTHAIYIILPLIKLLWTLLSLSYAAYTPDYGYHHQVSVFLCYVDFNDDIWI